MARPIIALDTETARFGPGQMAPPLACMPVWSGGAGHLFHWTESRQAFLDLAEHTDAVLVGHHIAYDMAVIGNQFPDLLPLIFWLYEQDRITDTGLRAKLLDIANGTYREAEDEDGKAIKLSYSLDGLSQRLLGRKLDKDTWRLRYGELRDYPLEQWPEGAKLYPIEDARATYDIHQVEEAYPHFLADQFRQARGAFWIQLMAVWGLRTSALRVGELAYKTEAEYHKLEAQCRTVGLIRPDTRKRTGEVKPGARNLAEVRKRLYIAYAGDPPMTERPAKASPNWSPQVSTSAETCKESGDPILEAYGKLGELKSVLSKDIPALLRGVQFPIHSRFESLLATGRTSSSDPNVQNPRRLPGVRECFVPRPGYVFVHADYSGLELATLAEVCFALFGYSALGDAINAGQDPHLGMAAEMLSADLGLVTRIRETRETINGLTYDRVDDARQTGKVANFGFPGGLGAFKLTKFAKATYNVVLTVDQARELKTIWQNRWPEMRDYFRYATSETDGPSPLVEQIYSKRFRGGVSFTQACNTKFQGLGSDLTKEAGWEISKACYIQTRSPLYGSRIANFVHDEFICETPEPMAHDAAHELSRIMVQVANKWLRHVRIGADPCVSRCWSKKAKPTKGPDGRLIPWDMS